MGVPSGETEAARFSLFKELTHIQVLLPIISSIFAVLSFVLGSLFSVWQTNQNAMTTRATQWRTAVQSIGIDEPSLVRSAYLLQTFDVSDPGAKGLGAFLRNALGGTEGAEDAKRKSQARTLEIDMMNRTNEPETFDLIFQNMLIGTSSQQPDEMGQLFEVQETILEHLQTSRALAIQNLPQGVREPDLKEFIEDPTPYFSSKDRKRLNETLILLWELDTFSNGMYCVWEQPASSSCPHFSGELDGTSRMLLVHWQIPDDAVHHPGFIVIPTCSVHHGFHEDDYVCEKQ